MRAEILRIQQDLQVTTVYVTHDQTEAMTLGDLVAVMKNGVLQQVASPHELYSDPVNLFVGGFIGSPAMNLVQAAISPGGDGGMAVEFGGHRLRIPEQVVAARPRLEAFRDRSVIVGIRPENLEDAALVPSADPEERFQVMVDLREGMGSDVYLHFSVDAPPVYTEDTRELADDIDEKAVEELKQSVSERRTRFIARASPETTAQAGKSCEIFLDARKLYFFDPATGGAIYGDREVAAVGASDGRSV
jgi:multiple sugar transport system ATP-binding protein